MRTMGTTLALGALLASMSLVSSCAGRSPCGQGRYVGAEGASNRPRPNGPYCMLLSAEGVGRLNVGVNRSGPVEDDEEPTAETTAATDPTGPVTYTAAPIPNPTSAWINVCSQPNALHVLPTVDDQYAMVQSTAVPGLFPIRMYNTLATPPFTISSNGWISFTSVGSGPLVGEVPNTDPPNLLVAPYWDDLYTRGTGICYGVSGTQPNRRFVIQWQDLHFCCTNDPAVHMTFEVVVHEARPPRQNNIIDVVYMSMQGASSRDGHGGIEDATGAQGVPIAGPWMGPRAIRFTPSR